MGAFRVVERAGSSACYGLLLRLNWDVIAGPIFVLEPCVSVTKFIAEMDRIQQIASNRSV